MSFSRLLPRLLPRLLTTTALAAISLVPVPAATAAKAPRATTSAAAGVDHSAFDKLLKKYVNEKGLVNYKAWKADQGAFNQYLAMLSKNPPAANWSKPEQMAYWINAYNAYTIRLILDHYPLQSIKDIGTKIQIPFVTTPWASKFFSIGGEKMSLDNIEHSILRKNYNDPRIHFALVCASISCPRLRTEAYTAAKLDAQLDDQGRDFLNNPAKNKPGKSSAQLSKYFDWYKGDWSENGQSVTSWVNKYATTKLDKNASISFLDYNWQLNEQ
ncbi:DUF547 domain-containing protein [Hymenobacter cellulosivorans]|uniref:DUF547 domain-containing protein n=1 Tax=Hymenobacter cellulosivorans TaxID=2932249 RepID=A0ABY4F3E1_9BACT|nr:DUF547 domain-containing protein [Hymenobacter cellulosivorans]UOQ50746.1 DUF547 domain-containing protein [Hymenobacter cellulosivorans]